MVEVKAYKLFNRVLVHFFDTGERDKLECPECGWCGKLETHQGETDFCSKEISCKICNNPLAFLSSQMEVDRRLELGISAML